ncbi:peptidase M16 [Streptomyces malachitofuscus]|nr:peptidase M16 [Streptomyces malachitofuscus]
MTTTHPALRTTTAVVDTVLPGGLRLVAVRDGVAPLVEIRLSIPCPVRGERDAATAQVLGDTLLRHTGTEEDALPDAWRIASLDSGRDVDRVGVFGYTPAAGLEPVLRVLAERLARPPRDADVVREARARLAGEIAVARGDARWTALSALLRHRYPAASLPCDLPGPEHLEHVDPDRVAAMHRARVRPGAATLVLVGDLDPEEAVRTAERALAPWRPLGPPPPHPSPSPPHAPAAAVQLVHRPRSSQAEVLLGGPAPCRTDPRRPAFDLANAVLGGGVGSRLSRSLREDKGYAYAVGSAVEVLAGEPAALIRLAVAQEHTAAALAEARRELSRLAEHRLDDAALAAAARLLTGRLATARVSPSATATFLSNLLAEGADLDWIDTHADRLAAVGPDDVREAAALHLRPGVLDTVVVGDADVLGAPLAAHGAVRCHRRLEDVTPAASGAAPRPLPQEPR